jgi:hypothetical protein
MTSFALPPRIKDAAKHGELVVFVGAGASRLCGSPDWNGFAVQVIRILEQEGKLNFLEAEQLRGFSDARRSLSVALGLAKEATIDIAKHFDDILHPRAPNRDGLELYELLIQANPVFVTTNYDKWLDQPQNLLKDSSTDGTSESEPQTVPILRPSYYRREHLTANRLTEHGAVIHLHGSYVDPSSMVVSLKDYIEHYADARVQNFLLEMFRTCTVVFIGYGLAELEILDYIVRSNTSRRDDPSLQHFLVYAYRSTEESQLRFVTKFFQEQCGIEVVPYLIDTRGFSELVEVMKSWVPELDVRRPSLIDMQRRIDDAVASGSAPQRESAIEMAKTSEDLAAHLLNSLTDPAWIKDLQDAGFFDTQNSPDASRIEEDGKISYRATSWPALSYLERIASQLTGDVASTVAALVRAISHDFALRGLRNWRTATLMASIFSSLPTVVVTADDIRSVVPWIKNGFDGSYIAEEIGTKLLPRLLDATSSSDVEKCRVLIDVLTTVRDVEVAK